MHNICQAGKTNKYMQDTEITGKMCRKGLMSLQIAIKEGKSLLLPWQFLESWSRVRIWS